MATKYKEHLEGQVQPTKFPDLNPDALLSLAKKIETNLKKPGRGAVSKAVPARPKANKSKKEKAREDLSNGAAEPKAYPTVQAVGKTPSTREQRPAPPPKSTQGKKRSLDGRVKEAGLVKPGDNVNGIKLGTRTRKPTAGKDANIEDDIQALGGTKDDMELIANVPSDSELEGDIVDTAEPARGDLRKELQQLVRQLGVDKRPQNDLSETSDSEMVDELQDSEPRIQKGGRMPPPIVNGLKSETKTQKPTSKSTIALALPPQPEWHTAPLPILHRPLQEPVAIPRDLSDRLQEYAKSLLETENQQYAAQNTSASSAHQFYSTIMSSGTLSDKISALTLSVQESPVHNMKALESLVDLARKRSRGQAVEVLGALKDLFGPGNLLPSDRKLRTFASQPALSAAFEPEDFQWTSREPLPKELENSHLIVWAYEDWLKSTFFEVLKIIETWCNDEVAFARGKAVDYVCQLLKEKPEQEANLLRLLVNKLGDSDKKIASKTSFNILQLETTHPLMKPTIISAIESDLLFRPGQSLHAQYYATITLNQTVLSGKEEGVARKLLDIYFNLFIKLLEKPVTKAKDTATGVNSITINRNGEVQGGGGSAGKKAQKKQAEKEKATTVDEDLREKMLSAVLTGVNRAMPFTNTNDESFEKHLNTLFAVTHSSNFNTSIQALMLIQQLNGSHQGSVDRFYRTLYESLLDPRLLTSSKQALYLNLLFSALRSDLNVKRVKAFAKRLLQIVTMHQPSFTCGTLYLLRELESVFANLSSFIDDSEANDDDEEETFRDVEDTVANGASQITTASTSSQQPHPKCTYDGRKRDPEYSNADKSSLWELLPLTKHYHPSVSLFATSLLTHAPMPPKPDLSLNTLIHFLDRFVYRNPKSKSASKTKGASIMQPLAGGDSSALLVSRYSEKERARQPVNSEAFWRQGSEKVGADEVFFHKYFATLGRGREKAKKKKDSRKKGGEDGSESEGDEDEVWKALVDSRPEVEGGSEVGFSDEDPDFGSEKEGLDDEEEGGGAKIDGQEAGNVDDASLELGDEDDEALFDSDDEVPSDLEQVFEKEVHGSKKKGATVAPATDEGEKRSKKRRRLKNLPTFASADDYAKMLDEDDDE
jgi:ribosome biogenesis protein MAK21